ncbi:MAG TPA: patatin-like phospholipase family protein [Candidatus Cloacimonadota bacterium]|nr:patatin-like phospholipase family protein [Candidatus Cloacimonadota bacterium]
MKKVGLCLGGGGARGLCHIEFLKVLDELQIKPSIISGTSMGSIIGAMYASGMSGTEIHKVVNKINFTDLLRMLDISILSRASLIKGRGVEEFLEKHIKAKTFEELSIPLKIVATDFWRQKTIVFDSGDLIPAIRSSIAIPAIFEPVIMGDRVLIDGGSTINLPFDLIRHDCNFLIAIDVSGSKTVPIDPVLPSWFENVMTTFEILQSQIIEFQLKVYRPDILVKPELKDINILDFEKSGKIMKSVAEDVKQFRAELLEKLKSRKLPFLVGSSLANK